MRCIPGKTTRSFCLKCRVEGQVIGYKSPIVALKCPVCGIEWRTISAICEKCRLPSGSPHAGDCLRCKRKEKSVS